MDPITIDMLAGSGQLVSEKFDQYAVVGELALDGSMRPTKGALSMAIAAAAEKKLPVHINEAINYRMLDRNLWS